MTPRGRLVGVSRDGPVLAYCAEDREMDAFKRIASVCAAQWVPHSLDGWVARWGPTDLTTGERMERSAAVSAVVAQALKSIDVRGIHNGLDRRFTAGALQALHRHSEPFNPQELRVWAMQSEWPGRIATDLESLAKEIIAGKSVRVDTHYRWDDMFDRWRAAVDK